MEKKFELKDLAGMYDKHFFLRIKDKTGEDYVYSAIKHDIEGVLAEIVDSDEKSLDYYVLAYIVKATDTQDRPLSEMLSQKYPFLTFSMDALTMLTDELALMRGRACLCNPYQNTGSDEFQAKLEVYMNKGSHLLEMQQLWV